jgi:hypothetical protein
MAVKLKAKIYMDATLAQVTKFIKVEVFYLQEYNSL